MGSGTWQGRRPQHEGPVLPSRDEAGFFWLPSYAPNHLGHQRLLWYPDTHASVGAQTPTQPDQGSVLPFGNEATPFCLPNYARNHLGHPHLLGYPDTHASLGYQTPTEPHPTRFGYPDTSAQPHPTRFGHPDIHSSSHSQVLIPNTHSNSHSWLWVPRHPHHLTQLALGTQTPHMRAQMHDP
jgi:hypothetical protein